MLLEIYLGMNVVAFSLMVLSFIPIGEKRKTTRTSETEELKNETQTYVVLFPWLSMGVFFLLATTAMDITVVSCDNVIDSINSSVANMEEYTTSWSCHEYGHKDFALPWFYAGFGSIMLVYAIISTFMYSAGTLIEEVNRLSGSERRN